MQMLMYAQLILISNGKNVWICVVLDKTFTAA